MGLVKEAVKSRPEENPEPVAKRRPTQADVARLAGVSTATVSHVLSGRADRKSGGNAETRRRVEEAMEALGYRPNWAGRALRRQRTGLVGALVSGPSNPWREHLIDIAQRQLMDHDLDLVVFPARSTDDGFERFFDLLGRGAVDACFTVHVDDARRSREFAASPVPVIAFTEEGFDGVARVRHHYADSAATAATALAQRGIRRFLIVKEAARGTELIRGDFVDPVLNALEVHGEPGLTSVVHGVRVGVTVDLAGLDWAQVCAATPDDPVVLLCASDRLAIHVIDECRRLGLAVGKSVGVVGRGDIAEARNGPIALSTLGGPDADYAAVFADLAEAAKTAAPIVRDWDFPWRFIERETTSGLLRP